MGEENNKSQNGNQPIRFNQEQYNLLKKCSDKKDITEWNQYRIDNRNKDIELEEACFDECYLKGVMLNVGLAEFEGRKTHLRGKVYLEGAGFDEANLEGANFSYAHMEEANLSDAHMNEAILRSAHLECSGFADAYLERADFFRANLEKANLGNAHLKGANFACAKLSGAHLMEANLAGVNFDMANLQSAFIQGANLQGAFIPLAHLEGADLIRANLQDAHLAGVNLQGAILREANLKGANFEVAAVDGGTLIWNCKVNQHNSKNKGTNFKGVGLDSIRIDPATKQLLEYNIRRMNWDDWYKEHPKSKWLFKFFWWISNYGSSEKRIVIIFSSLVFIFSIIYYLWGLISPTGIIDNLFVDRNGVQVPCWIVPLRVLYFSIITMTLGFSDMYAKAQSIWGHILVTLQAILGYILLGALVTRFAIMFTAGGPAGKFADEKKKEDADNSNDEIS